MKLSDRGDAPVEYVDAELGLAPSSAHLVRDGVINGDQGSVF